VKYAAVLALASFHLHAATINQHNLNVSEKAYVLFVGQFYKLITLDLSIGAHITMVNEPTANLIVGPSAPKGVVRRNVVTPGVEYVQSVKDITKYSSMTDWIILIIFSRVT
jgi:hypothetical protein